MREALDAPTLELPPEKVEEIRAFLDGQSRIKLAVWVRHEQGGTKGAAYDHHLVLGIDDEDWKTGDMVALEYGMELPGLDTTEPTWIDIYPVSEVDALRSFGTLLWEQASPGEDPLDYRLTHTPFAPEPSAAERLAALLGEKPGIRRIEATVERLWKGETAVRDTVRLYVDAPSAPNALNDATDAARVTVLEGVTSFSASLGQAQRVRTSLLYERAA